MEIVKTIKKYFAGIVIVICAIAYALNWISMDIFLKLITIFAGVGIYQISKKLEEIKVSLGK